MKNLILLSFFVFFGCQNKEPKQHEQNVTDSDIYEIVNLVLSENDEAMRNDGFKVNPYKYLLDRDLGPLFNNGDSIMFIKPDSIFTKQDMEFIEKQIDERKNFKFHGDSIQSKKVISSSIIQKMIDDKLNHGHDFYTDYFKKFGNDRHYTIGLPVFSKDKKTVFIKIDGLGFGQTAIYKKINGKWKYHCSGFSWSA